jgi:hypothetical protein
VLLSVRHGKLNLKSNQMPDLPFSQTTILDIISLCDVPTLESRKKTHEHNNLIYIDIQQMIDDQG